MSQRTMVWIGRASGPKGAIGRWLATAVAKRHPQWRVVIIGIDTWPNDWPAPAANVRNRGRVADPTPDYAAADLVIGAGRVVVEAGRCGCLVFAIGESTLIGLVTAANLDHVKSTNGGDCWAPAGIDKPPSGINWAAADAAIDACLQQSQLIPLPLSAWDDYALSTVTDQVERAYGLARLAAALGQHREVPILLYHRVVVEPVANSIHRVFVTAAAMRAQLASLRARGFTCVTFSDLLTGRRVRKPVLLTFDDGYRDNHDVLLPLLREFSARATIFCLGDRTLDHNRWDAEHGEPRAELMSDAEVRACHASGCVEIASHGLNHRDLRTCTDDELASELHDSKNQLENLIGAAVPTFAYPYGAYGDREAVAVEAAGYSLGVGTVNGPLHPSTDPYRIRRIQIMANDNCHAFWKKTSGWYLRYCRFKGKDFP